MIAVLLAVLTALLPTPADHGAHPHVSNNVASAAAAAGADGRELRASDGHFDVSGHLLRTLRDTPGERPAPPPAPTTTPLASYDGAHAPPPSARTSLPAADPRASAPPAARHQGRAPPTLPGS